MYSAVFSNVLNIHEEWLEKVRIEDSVQLSFLILTYVFFFLYRKSVSFYTRTYWTKRQEDAGCSVYGEK